MRGRLSPRHGGLLRAVGLAAAVPAAALLTGAIGPALIGWAVTADPAPPPAVVDPGVTGWPTPTENVTVGATMKVAGVFDGRGARYAGIGDGTQNEHQPAMFEVADGGVVSNVVLGAPAGDGIHCLGSCVLSNVWWEDVGEDAATFLGGPGSTAVVSGGGARGAADKVFQHNGAGALVVQGFRAADYGKLYRSCGNCTVQYARTVIMSGLTVAPPKVTLVGVNANYGDQAVLTGITVIGDQAGAKPLCTRYEGNDTGAEPVKLGTGADGASCLYDESAVARPAA